MQKSACHLRLVALSRASFELMCPVPFQALFVPLSQRYGVPPAQLGTCHFAKQ